MFFDDEDEGLFNHEVFHVVHREFCMYFLLIFNYFKYFVWFKIFSYLSVLDALSSNLDVSPFALRSVPTHTEDGIPIRKLYVSNLPPKVRIYLNLLL